MIVSDDVPYVLKNAPIITMIVTLLNFTLSTLALYANNFYANQRERRKETRAKIDSVNRSFDELERLIVDFYTCENFDIQKHEKVIRLLDKLQRSIYRIAFFKDNEELISSFVDLRILVTQNGFDQDDFLKQSHDSEKLIEIYNSQENVVSKIEEKYEEIFPVIIKSKFGKFFGR